MKKLGFASLVGLTLILSLLWHLPASWIFSQNWVRQQLPQNVQLSQIRGVWWQGQGHISIRPASRSQSVPIGTLSWQWHPSDILTGTVSLGLNLVNAEHQLHATLRQSAHSLKLQQLNGDFPIASLRPFLPANLAALGQVQGNIKFKALSIALDMPLANPWPTQVQGSVQIRNLKAYGVVLQQLQILPSLNSRTLQLNIQTQSPGWRLQGNLDLLRSHRYQASFDLTSETRESIPAWSKPFFKMQSPTKGTFNSSGRW
ncbi:MAG: type II secretion system protein N [Hydrogenovibrio sp.]|nr:type II secretion system protein N [Hydrogenovibrio sp.]